MKHALIAVTLMAMPFVSALAQLAPPDGALVGKVAGFAYTKAFKGFPITTYDIIVMSDSSFAGTPHETGSTVTLWAAGGRGWGNLDITTGSLSAQTLVVGEKAFMTYRQFDGHPYIMAKWTVWRPGAVGCHSDSASAVALLQEDIRLENFLSTTTHLGQLQDSLELFATAKDAFALAYPAPAEGKTWRDYALTCRRPAGTLRTVMGKIRERYSLR